MQAALAPRQPTYRIGDASDVQFVRTEWCDSFVRAARNGFKTEEFLACKASIRDGEWELSGKLLERSVIVVLEYAPRIVSFLVYDAEEPIIHYAFTARDCQRQGYFRQLFKQSTDLLGSKWSYSRQTPIGASVGRAFGGMYDQYSALRLLGALSEEA